MADVEHKNLTGSDLHECKGAATAPAGALLRAQGDGTALFEAVVPELKAANRISFNAKIEDISNPSSTFVASPLAGNIISVIVVLQGAITTANSIVTAKINGVAVSGLSVTITQAGSAAGSTFSGTPSGNNTIAAGQALEVITDGGSSTTIAAWVTVVVDTE